MKKTLGALLLLVGAVAPGRADEGKIPVFEPNTLIGSPGHYILTRDITATSGNGVTIQANDVTLDLNGHTITAPACSGTESAILVDTALATRGVVIRNGKLRMGCHGVFSPDTSRLSVRIENLDLADFKVTGINIGAAESAEVLNCHLHDPIPVTAGGDGTGIRISGGTTNTPDAGAFRGRVSDNLVTDIPSYAIYLIGLAAGEVSRNVVVDYGSLPGLQNGIILSADSLTWGAGWNLVEGNTIRAEQGDTDSDGIRANLTSPFNVFANNVVTGAGRIGILSSAEGTRIERNTVSGIGANGIESNGAGAKIEGNVTRNNGLLGIFSTGGEARIEGNMSSSNASCGIRSQGDNARVERNVANSNGSHGIQVGNGGIGSSNSVEENQAQGNTGGSTCGIRLENGNGHVYRNNIVMVSVVPQGNAGGGICGTLAGNTDGFGNIQ